MTAVIFGKKLPFQILALVLSALFVACGATAGWSIEPSGRIDEPDLRESSGLAASRRHRGVYWTHNDDGEPEIFAINRSGRLLARFRIEPARNVDWEKIALDRENNLYALDNTSRIFETKISTIYVFPEPDLRDSGKTIAPTRVLEFPFQQGGFDFEAMFCWKEFLYFVDKPWDAKPPILYRVELGEPEKAPEVLGQIPVSALITGADIDSTGTRIALISYRAVFIFEGTGGPKQILLQQPLVSPLNARQIEGVAWQQDELILSNEQRDIFRVPRNQWQKQEAPFYRSAKQQIPRIPGAPKAGLDLADWPAGRWLRATGLQGEIAIGRAAWSSEGIHIGIRLPDQLKLEKLDTGASVGFLDWFRPGRVYVMINPSGTRPLTYLPEDRSLVIGRGAAGELVSEARRVLPGTMIEASEKSPPWVRLEEAENHLVVTLTEQMPGLGSLQAQRQLGFNLIIMAADGSILSWTPLTLRFSWDCPSYWGLVETKQ